MESGPFIKKVVDHRPIFDKGRYQKLIQVERNIMHVLEQAKSQQTDTDEWKAKMKVYMSRVELKMNAGFTVCREEKRGVSTATWVLEDAKWWMKYWLSQFFAIRSATRHDSIAQMMWCYYRVTLINDTKYPDVLEALLELESKLFKEQEGV